MSQLTFKRFDTYPPLTVTLSDSNGTVDLTAASAIHMEMKAGTGGTIIASLAMSSYIATAGKIQHNWVASETSMPDTWNLEFEVLWNQASRIQTFPNTGQVSITIEADIEGA